MSGTRWDLFEVLEKTIAGKKWAPKDFYDSKRFFNNFPQIIPYKTCKQFEKEFEDIFRTLKPLDPETLHIVNLADQYAVFRMLSDMLSIATDHLLDGRGCLRLKFLKLAKWDQKPEMLDPQNIKFLVSSFWCAINEQMVADERLTIKKLSYDERYTAMIQLMMASFHKIYNKLIRQTQTKPPHLKKPTCYEDAYEFAKGLFNLAEHKSDALKKLVYLDLGEKLSANLIQEKLAYWLYAMFICGMHKKYEIFTPFWEAFSLCFDESRDHKLLNENESALYKWCKSLALQLKQQKTAARAATTPRLLKCLSLPGVSVSTPVVPASIVKIETPVEDDGRVKIALSVDGELLRAASMPSIPVSKKEEKITETISRSVVTKELVEFKQPAHPAKEEQDKLFSQEESKLEDGEEFLFVNPFGSQAEIIKFDEDDIERTTEADYEKVDFYLQLSPQQQAQSWVGFFGSKLSSGVASALALPVAAYRMTMGSS